jgi:hypothetical protein
MRNPLRTLTLGIAFAVTPAIAAAQQEKGDREIQVFGNLSSTSSDGGGSSTTGMLGGGLGYFLTRQVQLRGGVILTMNSSEGSSSSSNILTYGMAYNFATEGRRTFPYLGIDGYTVTAEDTPASTALRPNGGLKTFLSRNAAFDVNVGLVRLGSEGASSTTVDSRFGLSFVF